MLPKNDVVALFLLTMEKGGWVGGIVSWWGQNDRKEYEYLSNYKKNNILFKKKIKRDVFFSRKSPDSFYSKVKMNSSLS